MSLSGVAAILQQMAENAGRQPMYRGAVIGNTISQATQIPAQMIEDRRRQAVIDREQAQRDLSLRYAGNADDRARQDQEMQNAANMAAAEKSRVLKLGIAAGFGKSTDPKDFDEPTAIQTVINAGHPELAQAISETHKNLLPKYTEFDPEHGSQDAQGNVIRQPGAPRKKTESELAADAANPNSPTAAQSADALKLLKPDKPLTYGNPMPAVVAGKQTFIRAGSDGNIYGMTGQKIDGSTIEPEKDKAAASSFQLQPELDETGKQTGRFLGYNTKTNSWEPVKGQGPTSTKAAPGAATLAASVASKKEALGSLEQLDKAIDDAKDLIGPGAGRVSKLEQLVGNPDPKISALGTKLLLTKMQVDHAATGTVRAGASPQILSRWDNLLSQNLDAANLKSAVQAMRDILGSDSTAAKPSGIKSITEIK